MQIVRSTLGRDQVYERLRDAILMGELMPEEKLVEAHYSTLYGVSRTPIREAFRMLEKDGLVQHVPQRGTYVRSQLTIHEIEEVFMIRHALQMVSVEPTIRNTTKEEIDLMQECIEEGKKAVENLDIVAYVKSNNRFNHCLINSCKMPVLCSTLFQMERFNPVFSFIEESTPSSTFMQQSQRCAAALQEHTDILTSIRERNSDSLRQALSNHIENTRRAYLAILMTK